MLITYPAQASTSFKLIKISLDYRQKPHLNLEHLNEIITEMLSFLRIIKMTKVICKAYCLDFQKKNIASLSAEI